MSIDAPAARRNESPPGSYLTIQALRGIAALLVVVIHIFEVWSDRVSTTALGVNWQNGAAGVDIFFVVSGFVMVVSTQGLTEGARTGLKFLERRIIRIVPLYWLLTTAKLAALLTLPTMALRTTLDPGYLLGSFLFLPVIDLAGHFRPLIAMGWTLTYEFVFYILFAAALMRRLPVLCIAVPGLGFIAGLALMRQDDWPVWTIIFSPIVIEFIYGVLLGQAIVRGCRLHSVIAMVLLFVGSVAIMSLPRISDNLRALTWGLPAFAIVASAVSLESVIAKRLPRWLLSLGDASYSIYLGHGFVLPFVIVVTSRTISNGLLGEMIAIVLCTACSAATGVLMYVWVEKPFIEYFRGRQAHSTSRNLPAKSMLVG